MRVTHEALLKVSRETTEFRVRKDRSIAAAYLCGSLLRDDYALGGAADIDLVFIHIDTPPVEREITALTREVSLDIAHHAQQIYRQGKQLRLHPWLGPTLNSCKVLYDPQHIIDFIQASVRGQFDSPEHIYARVESQYSQARAIWSDLQRHLADEAAAENQQKTVQGYLRALGHAANAIASLSGAPLTERRMLLDFRSRAEAAGKPGLFPGLLGLLGSPNLEAGDYPRLVELWEQVYSSLPAEKAPPRLHPARHAYYARAFSVLIEQNRPETILWPLLHTLSQALETLDDGADAQKSAQTAAWNILSAAGLQGAELRERLLALDAYLDLVEETLEGWTQEHGVEQ